MADTKLPADSTILDLRDQLVAIGDTIASAFSRGRSASVRVGRVVALYRRDTGYGDPDLMLEVEWLAGDGWRVKTSKISGNLRRFIKVVLPE